MVIFSRTRIVIGLLSLIVILNFLSGCGEKGSQPVARVGGRIITVQEFKDSFSRGKSKEILQKATLQEKIDHLNKMIDKELQIVAAYRMNLDKDSDIEKKVEKRGEATILRRLVDKEVIDPNIPESEIKKFYNKSKKAVKVLEINLRMSSHPSDQEKEDIENKLEIIKKEIEKGTDFATLVKKYSQQRSLRRSPMQDEEILKWTPSNSTNPVYQKAFSMKVGEISEPIKIKRGYSIIKVVDIIDAKLRPYSVERRRIRQGLLRLNGKELESKYFEYLDKLKKKYNVQINGENISKFVEIMNDTSRNKQVSKWMERKGIISRFTADDKKLLLVRYSDGEISIGNLLEELSNLPITRRPNLHDSTAVYELINRRILPQKLLTMEAEAKNIKNDKEVVEKFKSFRESYMLSKIKQMEINDKISITDEDLKKYFEDHREQFKHPERREVQEISVKDEKLAQEIARRAKAGEDFTKLAKKYNEKSSTKKNNGHLGFITRTRPHIGKVAFETPIGKVAGPIKVGKNYSIIKVLSKKEASYKTFDEAKNYIRARVNREYKKKREQEWLDELRKNIEVVIYKNKLEDIFN